MPQPGSRRRSRTAAGLPPITPEKVLDAAVELTREYGLEGWTVRKLAEAVGVYPTVIYHHVGDREAVLDAVTDQVISAMPLPDAGLGWREWHGSFLHQGRPVLRRHPGVARRLVLYGPTVPATKPAIDLGVQVLERAGFSRDATLVYRYLLNSAFMLVAAEDDQHSRPGRRERVEELLGPHREDPERPGLAAAGADVLQRAADPRGPEELAADFYAFTVARALDGAEAWLHAIRHRT